MIVVGLDVHKHSLTAVVDDELGRAVAEQASAIAAEPLLEWARARSRRSACGRSKTAGT
jgi:hypothetical protein